LDRISSGPGLHIFRLWLKPQLRRILYGNYPSSTTHQSQEALFKLASAIYKACSGYEPEESQGTSFRSLNLQKGDFYLEQVLWMSYSNAPIELVEKRERDTQTTLWSSQTKLLMSGGENKDTGCKLTT
jgi:hypothetical protein